MPIIILEPDVVAKIAAGEVVERPASVVKELVENSLDAASSQISVEISVGGTSLIRVTDNGVGIPAAELELVCQRHATSKISSLDDLESITSLGFRGEALPSIAAVAEVEITTCATGESTGSYLSVQGRTTTSQGSRGRPPGTTVTVRNLFGSVPARRKFLKSAATENGHVANIVSQYALAFPEVKFTLSTDGRNVLRTPGSGRLIDSMLEVYGLEIARNMLEINGDNEAWAGETASVSPRITGMIGSPTISRSSRNYLSFFVNRRSISSRLLAWAVEEAYHGLLMSGKHPVAIINITLPANEVDINIHPAKTEVRFQNERAVFTAVQKAVRRALIAQAPTPMIEEVATTYAAPSATGRTLWPPAGTIRKTDQLPPAAPLPMTFSLPALRLLGQLSGSYIVAEGPDGLYLIDQHAAHERVLFEQIQQQGSQRQAEVQGLLEPVTIEVSPREANVLQVHHEELADSGFQIEPFGERAYLVRAIPAILYEKDWMDVLRELLDSPAGNWAEKIAVSIACHSAVRAGQVLNNEAMRDLLRQLEQTIQPNTCPHGRPTMIHLSSGQLAREFGRS